jgi:hypothetical protein
MVESQPSKLLVAGSIPVSRSIPLIQLSPASALAAHWITFGGHPRCWLITTKSKSVVMTVCRLSLAQSQMDLSSA